MAMAVQAYSVIIWENTDFIWRANLNTHTGIKHAAFRVKISSDTPTKSLFRCTRSVRRYMSQICHKSSQDVPNIPSSMDPENQYGRPFNENGPIHVPNGYRSAFVSSDRCRDELGSAMRTFRAPARLVMYIQWHHPTRVKTAGRFLVS